MASGCGQWGKDLNILSREKKLWWVCVRDWPMTAALSDNWPMRGSGQLSHALRVPTVVPIIPANTPHPPPSVQTPANPAQCNQSKLGIPSICLVCTGHTALGENRTKWAALKWDIQYPRVFDKMGLAHIDIIEYFNSHLPRGRLYLLLTWLLHCTALRIRPADYREANTGPVQIILRFCDFDERRRVAETLFCWK